MFVLLTLAGCLCGALSHTCAKVALRDHMPTYRFFAVRIVAGVVASLALYLALLDPAKVHFYSTPGPFLPALILGILVPFASNVFYFEALRRGDLCVVSPAGHISPLFTILLAWPVLGEAPNAGAALALALILAGLVLSSRSRHHEHPGLGVWVVLPILLATGTSLSNAFNYVFQKKLMHELPKADINFLQNLVSLVLFALYFVWETRAKRPVAHPEQHPGRNILLTVASGVLVFSLSNLFFLMALVGAPTVSVAMMLATLGVPISALAGWTLLRERPRRIQLLGGLLIFLGALAAMWAGN